VFRFADGKIVECHDLPDALSLLRQLGGLPG
jgi:ketosteroid isomerase-like protein